MIVGRMTVEGAPHLEPSTTRCSTAPTAAARRASASSRRCRHVQDDGGGAAVPLAARSRKTVNLPNEATVDEVAEIYEEGWKLGLKAVALYRDGCKASQPLSTSSDEGKDKARSRRRAPPSSRRRGRRRAAATVVPRRASPQARAAPERSRACACRRSAAASRRRRASAATRSSCAPASTRTASLGEIFIDMHKEGAAFRSLMNCFAMARLDRPAVRRAARDVRRAVHVHALRAAGRRSRVTRTSSSRRRSSTTSSACSASSTCSATTSRTCSPAKRCSTRSEPDRRRRGRARPSSRDEHAPPRPSRCRRAARAVRGDRRRGAARSTRSSSEMMGDAPVCDGCGHITVRNGACYKCLNCGNSMGCS